jgi:hypothetical protein
MTARQHQSDSFRNETTLRGYHADVLKDPIAQDDLRLTRGNYQPEGVVVDVSFDIRFQGGHHCPTLGSHRDLKTQFYSML